MDVLSKNLQEKDIKKRLLAVEETKRILLRESLMAGHWQCLIEPLTAVLRNNNFKICQGALECLEILAEKAGDQFQPFCGPVLSAVVEQLGDNKDLVGAQAVKVTMKLASIAGLEFVYGRLEACFQHKNWKAKKQLLVIVELASREYGSRAANPSVLNLVRQCLEDPSPEVRQQAIVAANQLFTVLGPKFMVEMESRGLRNTVLNTLKLNSGTPFKDPKPKHKALATPRSLVSGKEEGSRNLSTEERVQQKKSSISKEEAAVVVEVEVIDGDPIALVEVYTQHEMVDQVAAVGIALAEKTDDWQARLVALQTLHGLSLGQAPSYERFIPEVRTLVLALTNQLADLRSQVVKEACRTIAALAEATKENFQPLAESCFPSLLKLVQQSIKVMSSSGDRCAKGILTATKNGYPKVIPILLNNCTAKNQNVRVHCFQYMMIALVFWNTPALDRLLDSLPSALKAGLKDADAQARAAARLCFWAFHKRAKERADRLFGELELIVQRRLLQEDVSSAPIRISRTGWTSIPSLPVPPSRPASAPGPEHEAPHPAASDKRPATAFAAGPSRPSGAVRVVVNGKETADSKSKGTTQAKRAASDRRQTMGSFQIRSQNKLVDGLCDLLSKEDGETTKEQTSGACTSGKTAGFQFHAVPSQNSLKHSSSTGFHHTLGGGASRVAVQPKEESGPSTHKEKIVRRTSLLPQRVVMQEDSKEPLNCVEKLEHKINGALRVQTTKEASKEAQEAKKDTKVTALLPNENDADHPGIPAQKIKDLLEMSVNDHWATRLECVDMITRTVKANPLVAQEKSFSNQILGLILNLIMDGHYKVSLCAIKLLGVVANLAPAALQHSLPSVLMNVFNKLVDQKQLIRDESNLLLNQFARTFDCSALCAAVCPMLMDLPDKARAAAIEFVATLCVSAPAYLSNPHSLRTLLHRLGSMAHHSSRSPQALQQASMQLLVALFHMSPPLFQSQVLQLPDEAQARVKAVMKTHISAFEKLGSAQTKSEAGNHLCEFNIAAACRDDLGARGSPNSNGFKRPLQPLPPSPGKSKKGCEDYFGGILMADGDVNSEAFCGDYSQNPSKVAVVSKERTPLMDITSPTANKAHLPSQPSLKTKDKVSRHESFLPLSGMCAPKQCNTSTLERPPVCSATAPPVSSILQALGPGEHGLQERLLAMRQIVELSKKNDKTLWASYFSQFLLVLLEGIRESSFAGVNINQKGFSKLRQAALLTLSSMILYQGQLFNNTMEVVFDSLLACCRDSLFEIVHTAERNLELLVTTLDPEKSLTVMLPYLKSGIDEPVTLSSLKTLCKLVPRLPSPFLLENMPSISSHSLVVFNHHNPEIRKAVVHVLVEIYFVLGDIIFEFLSKLSPTQKKLVTIYINKRSSNIHNEAVR